MGAKVLKENGGEFCADVLTIQEWHVGGEKTV